MSFLGIKWKPLRTVGQIGDVVSKLAPLATLIPGVGPLAAAGLKAGGSIAGKLNDRGGLSKWKPFKETILPAATTYGVSKIGSMLASRGGNASSMLKNPGAAPLDESLEGIAQIGQGMPAVASMPAGMSPMDPLAGGFGDYGRVAKAAAPAASVPMRAPPIPNVDMTPKGHGIGRAFSKIGKFYGDKTAGGDRLLASTKLAETGLNAYGAYKQGQYVDYQNQLEEDQRKRMQEMLESTGIGPRLIQLMQQRSGARPGGF